MSFRLFIYYCALCGGWAAFLVWGFAQLAGVSRIQSLTLHAALMGGLIGGLVAAAVGLIDAILNATGFQRISRALLCGGLGAIGGAIGAMIGQLLYFYASIPPFVGWMLAGVLIGGAIGGFDVLQAITSGQGARGSFRKMLNGVLGGLLGGLIGGLPYTYQAVLFTKVGLPRTGLALSLVLLGACIGLMIGLAQIILKEAWLEVEEGFRSGRQLLLTKDETTIGRAESCDLGLFGDNGIEKLHARILLKNNRYLLAHAAEGGETSINDEIVGDRPVPLRSGDAIRIGKSLLRFGERQKRK